MTNLPLGPPPIWCPGFNKTHPIASGIELAYPCWDTTGQYLGDYSGLNQYIAINTPFPIRNDTAMGPALTFGEGGFGQTHNTIRPFNLTTWTFGFWIYLFNNSSAQENLVFQLLNGGVTILWTANSVYTGSTLLQIPFYGNNQWHFVASVQYDDNIVLYLDGKKQKTVTASTVVHGKGSLGSSNGDTFYATNMALWNRALSGNEIQKLFEDPWLLYKPQNSVMKII